ncbi:MAG: hypothetical protein EOO52_08700 [Gammaproteobacteria bacterium]|nr:MAG: hypothetical protein EOO52_08700 [Gammaproteobacteria bacterium]
MVDAVLLILREVLEAALIVSLLLALTYKLGISYRWSISALLAGFLGSMFLAYLAPFITEAMDGRGQELLNACLYMIVIICVLWVGFGVTTIYFLRKKCHQPDSELHIEKNKQDLLTILCALVVSFSLAREGSEIWIYFSSFDIQSQSFFSALIGAAIGIGIGMSLGGITYYALVFMRNKYFLPGFIIVVTLLAGGLSLQIAKQFLQIGLLESNGPLWDSSFLINEKSWLGELLYALFGYDAQPTAIQSYFYLAATSPMLLAFFYCWRANRENKNA